MNPDIKIRPAIDDDRAFIKDSWIESYKGSSKFTENIPPFIYFKFHRAVIERILNRETTSSLIATAYHDEEIILGYMIVENVMDSNIVHYIYVKRPFAKFGIRNKLFDASPFPIKNGAYASHWTYKGKKLIQKYGLIYNPYVI